jgi:hypothetical protein
MPSQWSQEEYVAALKYAAAAHLGQKVPGSDLPYVVHVAMVAMEVIAALQVENGIDGDLAVQCALLHDVIEDAEKSYDELEANFGKEVADGVLALTKSNLIQDKSDRMAECLSRIKPQPREIGMVKMADRIVNLEPPPADWSTEKRTKYREEAIKICESLGSSSNFLDGRLAAKISDYLDYIPNTAELKNPKKHKEYKDNIISKIASAECERVCSLTIKDLEGMTDGLQSSEDSGLINIWDEVCVQVQYDQSMFWDAYIEVISGIIAKHLKAVPECVKEAIWLQTEAGRDWAWDNDDSDEPEDICIDEDEAVDYILHEYVLTEAGGWSNKAISDYLDRC